jgi:hypothetical protein
MTNLAAVPDDADDLADVQLELFEGNFVVQRYRLNPGTVGEFILRDENGEDLKLSVGDRVAIQCDVLIEEVSFRTKYKGLIQTKARDRVHHGKVMDGTQQVVHVERHK